MSLVIQDIRLQILQQEYKTGPFINSAQSSKIHQKYVLTANTAAFKLLLETEKHCETEVYETNKQKSIVF